MTPDHKDAYEVLRHSAAHLFAQAAKRLFPNLHLGVGPAIAEGFTMIQIMLKAKFQTKICHVSELKCKNRDRKLPMYP